MNIKSLDFSKQVIPGNSNYEVLCKIMSNLDHNPRFKLTPAISMCKTESGRIICKIGAFNGIGICYAAWMNTSMQHEFLPWIERLLKMLEIENPCLRVPEISNTEYLKLESACLLLGLDIENISGYILRKLGKLLKTCYSLAISTGIHFLLLVDGRTLKSEDAYAAVGENYTTMYALKETSVEELFVKANLEDV